MMITLFWIGMSAINIYGAVHVFDGWKKVLWIGFSILSLLILDEARKEWVNR